MRDYTYFHAIFAGLALTGIVLADPIVKLKGSDVTYRGVTKGSVEDFHNIKFAHDTSGARRFSPPEPYAPPKGSKIDATTRGAACPQLKSAVPPFFDETPEQSEDCLNLRITRPSGTTARDNLPVVVHLVGGGVVKASTYDSHFDPANLLTRSVDINKPVIHVVMNYRVTIFGFARLPILFDQKSLNVGMRDQRVGFKWIKDNIAAFGGDPDKITSFGLSAGGTFTSLHLLAYGGDQGVPFTQGWTMSGPPGTAVNMTSDAVEIHTRAVAEKLGCGNDKRDEELLECLRDIPMNDLTETAMEYSASNHPPIGTFTFIPSIDGDFLPDRQTALYKAGKFVKGIPMVFGWTQDDGATNAGPAATFETEEDMKTPIRMFAHALTEEDFQQLFSFYPASDFVEEVQNYEARKSPSDPAVPIHYFRVSRIIRDLLFTCSAIDFGFEISKQSKLEDPTYPGVRLYDLNQSMVSPQFHAAGMPYLGAIHGSDLDYYYNNMLQKEKTSVQDQKLSDYFISSFVNFAYTGDPNGVGLSPWPESFPGSQRLTELAAESNTAHEFNLQLIGGPLGTGACLISNGKDENTNHDTEGTMQNRLGEIFEYGEMGSAGFQGRHRQLRREKLFERCEFIGSLAEKLGH